MLYIIIKALHIIFMVSYFAGIFYLVRLLVYYKDTDNMPENKQTILREQYIYMITRLWNIITIPAGSIMIIAGIIMIIINPQLLSQKWFHLKITFLIGLGIYHYWTWKTILKIKKLKNQSLPIPNIKLRQYNEIATFILFLVVFTVVLKHLIIAYWLQLSVGFIALVIVIITIVKQVNKNKK